MSTYISNENVNVPTAMSPGMMAKFARCAILSMAPRLEWGSITIVENGRSQTFSGLRDPSPMGVTITVHHPDFWSSMLWGGTIGAGESYMDGHWDCDNLPELIRLIVRNSSFFTGLETGMTRFTRPLLRLAHRLHNNSRRGSRRNIAAHYDLGNEFFALFLDPTMTYSCGYFERPDSTLEEASRAKNDRICRKIELGPQDHLLEIGTGWGGFAVHAASNYGCHVTTTTISPSQHALALRRVREEGVADRVTLLLEDYRDLDGAYDKIVSIEMIEAVGYKFYDTFFQKCSSLLKPAGVMALQAITTDDRSYRASIHDIDFIKRYIFPGGQLPSITAICESVTAATDLRLYNLEDITEHYVKTLLHWRENFLAGLDRVRAMDYPERFIRMWDFYLSLCAGSFSERYTGDVQMLLVKPEFRVRHK